MEEIELEQENKLKTNEFNTSVEEEKQKNKLDKLLLEMRKKKK